ncbi:MAG: DegV family protein [Candidatus Heimdallarchaeota archaeon]|nr:DegV family protein [Candidatus Heimdallarchaeota archaeon]
MKIRVITDSAADLPEELLEKFNIVRIPHIVFFEDKPWKLGIDISVADFYEKLKKSDFLPSSSNPEPTDFVNHIKDSLEELEYDHVFCVSVAKDLSSSTFLAVRIAAKEFKNQVTIINTESASGVQGLVSLTIAELAEKGNSVKEITEKITKAIDNYYLNVGFHTLDNVYRSGRLKSKFILNLTKLIGIKPIAEMERPGSLESRLPGFFTNRSMINRLTKLALKGTNSTTTYNLVICHVNNQEGANTIIKRLKKKRKIDRSYVTPATPIIGSNTGMGTIIVSLLPAIS